MGEFCQKIQKLDMAFYKNKISCLNDLMNEMLDGQAPNEFSFLGIIDRQDHEQDDERNPNRIRHEVILHDGSKTRLHVQYYTGYDEDFIYDEREIDDSECPFYPKATICFLPRLQLTYVDGDSIFCTFKGGDLISGRMVEPRTADQKEKIMARRVREEKIGEKIEPSEDMMASTRNIGPNRICLILDVQPSSIDAFLTNNEVSLKFIEQSN